MARAAAPVAGKQYRLEMTEAYPYPPAFRVQLVREHSDPLPEVEDCFDVVEILTRYLNGVDREHFVLVGLNSKNQVIGLNTVHIGTLTASIVGAREVFKAAMLMNASSIIVAHNHPSGDPTPSPEDIDVTVKLAQIGELLDIPLLDHIVLGDLGRWTSLRRDHL